MKHTYTAAKLKQKIIDFTEKCIECAKCKISKVKYGKISGNLTYKEKFKTVAVDIYGPITHFNKKRLILTVVDLCSRWIEFVEVKSLKSRGLFEALNYALLKSTQFQTILYVTMEKLLFHNSLKKHAKVLK